MDPRLQLRIQRYGWDMAAPVYHDAWEAQLAAVQAELLSHLSLEPGLSVVETAAGTGMVTMPIADAVGQTGQVHASDLSDEMVAGGRTRVEAHGFQNIEFTRMNCEALDYPEDKFDRAACALGLMYVPDCVKALEEMRRVVKPDGLAGVAIWGERRKCGWADVFPIVDARVASEVCPLFFRQGAPGALRQDFEQAGFTDYRETRIDVTMDFPSDRALVAAVIDGGPVALAARRFDETTRKEVDAEFLDSVRDFRAGEGYRIPGEFVIATGRPA